MSDTPRTARDALKAQGEIVRKSYENKIARLERELAAAQKDAERYRWLRDNRDGNDVSVVFKMSEERWDYAVARTEHTFDAAIDEAMKEMK
jgi:hypothetical protein